METKDMIEEETHYYCKKCGRRYCTKESAVNCYKSHPKVVKIIDQIYEPPYNEPTRITVELDKGTVAIYNLVV